MRQLGPLPSLGTKYVPGPLRSWSARQVESRSGLQKIGLGRWCAHKAGAGSLRQFKALLLKPLTIGTE